MLSSIDAIKAMLKTCDGFLNDYFNIKSAKPQFKDYVKNKKADYIAFHQDLRKYIYGFGADNLATQFHGLNKYLSSSIIQNVASIKSYLGFEGSEYLNSVRDAYNQANDVAKAKHEKAGNFKHIYSFSDSHKNSHLEAIESHKLNFENCHKEKANIAVCKLSHPVPAFKCPEVLELMSNERNEIKSNFQDAIPLIAKLFIYVRNFGHYDNMEYFHKDTGYDCAKIAASVFKTGGADMRLRSNANADYADLTFNSELVLQNGIAEAVVAA